MALWKNSLMVEERQYHLKENKSNYSFQYIFIQKIYKNQSKKLSQCNLIWMIIIKFKNFKLFHVFIIIFMLMRKKSDIKAVKNKIWHLILLLFAIIAVHYMFNILEISRKNSRKKVWFSNQNLNVSKIKNINLLPAIL